MKRAIFSCCALMIAGAAALPAASADLSRPEIWLTPFAPYLSPDGRSGAPDYFDLFKTNAAWPVSGAHVKVFKIYLGQVIDMSDDALKTIIQGLAARNISLAMEANVLIDTSVCAPGVGKAGPITPVVQRLKALGADLRYLAMNEPLWNGHLLPPPYNCQATIPAVAADTASALKPLYAIYPNLQVGDIEPIGRDGTITETWPDQIGQFIIAYQAASGRPLAFMQSDTVWGRDWQTDLVRLGQITQAAKIPFGELFDGDYSELSDAAWAANTARYAAQVEATAGIHLDQVNFQVWDRWPQHSLPETDYTTMTGMVRDYLRSRSTITDHGGWRVQVTDELGAPMPNVTLQVEVKDQNFGSSATQQFIAGEVPPGAASALLALRVNAECQCPRALVHFSMTGVQYGEQGTTIAYDQAKSSWDLHQWLPYILGSGEQSVLGYNPAIEVIQQPGQGLVLNGPPFPVHAGAQFQTSFTWEVSQPSDGAGYISVIFLDGKGQETRRTLHLFSPTWRNAETITTDDSGYAGIPVHYLTDNSGSLVAFSYGGDANHRPGWLLWR